VLLKVAERKKALAASAAGGVAGVIPAKAYGLTTSEPQVTVANAASLAVTPYTAMHDVFLGGRLSLQRP
jgi:hypothetical protein